MNVKKPALALALALAATTANAIPVNRTYLGVITATGTYSVDVPCVVGTSDFCPPLNNVDISAGTEFLVSMSFGYRVDLPLPVGPAGEELRVSTPMTNPQTVAFAPLGVPPTGGGGMSNHRVNLFTDNAVPFGGMEP